MMELRISTVEEFMGLYIDFWQFLYIPQELRIKNKERQFMVHTLTLNAKGVDIAGKEYVDEMIERMGLNTRTEIYNYRSRLKRKGFLAEEHGRIVVPRGLNVTQIPRETIFKFRAYCEQPTVESPSQQAREVSNMTEFASRPSDKPKLPNFDKQTVILPEKKNVDGDATGHDSLRDSAAFAGNIYRGNIKTPVNKDYNYTSQSVDEADSFRSIQQKGYSSEERLDKEIQRDRTKIPPLPGVDDELGSGESGRERGGVWSADAIGRPEKVVTKSKPIIDLNE